VHNEDLVIINDDLIGLVNLEWSEYPLNKKVTSEMHLHSYSFNYLGILLL
jgi:hypothetical protein